MCNGTPPACTRAPGERLPLVAYPAMDWLGACSTLRLMRCGRAAELAGRSDVRLGARARCPSCALHPATN